MTWGTKEPFCRGDGTFVIVGVHRSPSESETPDGYSAPAGAYAHDTPGTWDSRPRLHDVAPSGAGELPADSVTDPSDADLRSALARAGRIGYR